MKRENIVRHTPDEILKMNRIGATGTDWERVHNTSEAEIERLAIEDMDEHGVPHDWYKYALPVRQPRLQSIEAGTDNLIIAEIVSHAIAIIRAIPGTSRAPGVVHAVLGSPEHAYEVPFTIAANA